MVTENNCFIISFTKSEADFSINSMKLASSHQSSHVRYRRVPTLEAFKSGLEQQNELRLFGLADWVIASKYTLYF